ncbi:TPA: PilZ domain-containing protein [Klebsiella quasipneumoniae subsp. quasipneumoniae]|uniref:PilZ domain-containing protein n=1 Tax=Klebsiella pneumoniae complex TaxID=3390273 RepID=UPI0029DB7C25|nr:PilZ domain-containing protein [Klebsiella pneumoniae]MDX7116453.1 PilZ domain-containing protein [Klebsiella pneumoniae]
MIKYDIVNTYEILAILRDLKKSKCNMYIYFSDNKKITAIIQNIKQESFTIIPQTPLPEAETHCTVGIVAFSDKGKYFFYSKIFSGTSGFENSLLLPTKITHAERRLHQRIPVFNEDRLFLSGYSTMTGKYIFIVKDISQEGCALQIDKFSYKYFIAGDILKRTYLEFEDSKITSIAVKILGFDSDKKHISCQFINKTECQMEALDSLITNIIIKHRK